MKKNIVIQAPMFSTSGYGAHSRDIVFALHQSGKFNVAGLPVGWGDTSLANKLPRNQMLMLQEVVANRMKKGENYIWMQIGMPNEFKRNGTINIGVTAGVESTMVPPHWIKSLNNMDHVVVPSEFVAAMFRNNGVTVPVHVVGEGVDVKQFDGDFKEVPTELAGLLDGLPTEFNFLTGGQWLGGQIGEDRKGIGLTINTFLDTFKDNPNVGLILKTFGYNSSSVDAFMIKDRLRRVLQGRKLPHIYLLSGELDDVEMSQLYTHPKVNAFVTMTSGEGWGRMILEAQASGLPVLATEWSGQTDFLPSNTYSRIKYKLDKVPMHVVNMMPSIFHPDAQWAYPDVKDTKHKMKRIYEKYDTTLLYAKQEGVRTREKWSKAVTYDYLIKVLDILKLESDNVIKLPGA